MNNIIFGTSSCPIININGTVKLRNSIMQNKMPSLSISTSSGSSIYIDDCFIQYMDIIAFLLGINIDYESFSKLTDDERKSFITSLKRDIKFKELNI